MSGIAHGKALAALKNHFRHAARLCRFDARKGFGSRGFAGFAAQVQIHQRLVHLQAVFHERDLEFFGVQPAAQSFESSACLGVGGESRGAVGTPLRKLPAKKVRLVGEHRRLQALNPRDSSMHLRFRDCRFSDLDGDAGQKKMRENGFAGEQSLIKKSGCSRTQPPCLKVTPFVEEQQSLVQIQQPRPH